MNRKGLKELDRRRSAMGTGLAWLVAVVSAAILIGLVVWSVLE